MTFSQVFKQFRLRQEEDSAVYHLLGNESNDKEKAEDGETATFDVELGVSPVDTNNPKKQIFTWRWLRVLSIFLPSFLHIGAAQGQSKNRRPTAWLDGLRGVTALFVVLHHMSLIWFSWDIHNGWIGWNDHLIQLPIIRLVISGRPNVMIFFVISGYALSYKPLSLVRKGEYLKTYQVLASSIFRRHPRLFIPAILICLPAPVITHFGGLNGEAMPGAAIGTKNPPRFDTIWGQFGNYITTLLSLSDIYSPGDINWAYSDSLWTLPIEFKGSLIIFTMLIALSRCTTRARVVITLCVAFYSFWYFHWAELLFIGGMLAVELSLRSQRSASVTEEPGLDDAEDDTEVKRSISPWAAPFMSRAFRRSCGVSAFLVTLLLLSMPEQGRGAADSYGFKMLSWLIPVRFHAAGFADYFWRPLAAIVLVIVIDRARFLQGIFKTRLAQYLGRVSFALYLVHMLILHSLGFWLGKYFLQITGSNSYWQYGTGVSLAAAVVGCVIIWAADLGSRFVDTNAVRFTAWAYRRLLCKI
ncbi:acyltransferase family-domain-containing protein [Nemania abortiva]|nr:acyltransferase family-domain-containing protein [Nemania abortiva]